MTLADSNVWLALVLSGHEHHSKVAAWFKQQPTGAPVVFCRSTQLALFRLLTTRAVTGACGSPALTNQQAWKLYSDLSLGPRISFVEEPAGLDVCWERLVASPTSSPKLWMDAYLAAFAIAGKYRFATIDGAFTQCVELDLILL